MLKQLSLFDVAGVFIDHAGPIDNTVLYESLSQKTGLDLSKLNQRQPIGRAGAMHSPLKRQIRWHQQTLKSLGVIERVDRGQWQLSEKLQTKAGELDRILPGVSLVAFSTDLGVAIWSRHETVLHGFSEQIALCITSPPYPLRVPRAYGGPSAGDYSDFICKALEPVVASLLPGGSIVLNVGNDVFEEESPARSTYQEEMVLALKKRLGLFKMDMIPWANYSKAPGPTYWACVKSVQLSAAYESVYWFTNDPKVVRADNRRILNPHNEEHLRTIQAGGARRSAKYGDGAYSTRPHSYGNPTLGKLPRNVLELGHRCADTNRYRRDAKASGLPLHGALFPTALPDIFIRFLTEPDVIWGWVTQLFTSRFCLAAERLGRRWMVIEWIKQYLQGGANLFKGFPSFQMGNALG